MGKYVSAPRAAPEAEEGEWWFAPLLPNLHLPDSAPIKTGLLDSKGNEIWRTPNPIGFGRDEEWG